MPTICHTPADLQTARTPRAVVMTMGALHDGHMELVRAARDLVTAAGEVVVTIFVNPLQFGPGEDFDKYPRTLTADVERCAEAGVDLVFAPSASLMYPTGEPATWVMPGAVAEQLEGISRPGHFAGMLTVVAKLLHLTAPDFALFGEKDFQQLTLIEQMVTDLNFPVQIVPVPTVREADGLAMSSRNIYLSPEQRAAAAKIPAALAAARTAAAAGAAAEQVLAAARTVLAGEEIDYLQLRSRVLGPVPTSGEARLLVAVRFGATRLLDNCAITLRGEQ